MSKYKSLRLVCLALLAFGVSATVASAMEKDGIITWIYGRTVVVTTPTDQTAFTVMASTLVTLNGLAANVTDLRVGDEAIVSYAIQVTGSPIPQRVDALRRPGPYGP